jgi:hypothetical protein
MPIVNNNQARIELSAATAAEFARIIMDQLSGEEAETRQPVPMIYIEETNLGDTVVVGGRGMPMTLVEHSGDSYRLSEKVK